MTQIDEKLGQINGSLTQEQVEEIVAQINQLLTHTKSPLRTTSYGKFCLTKVTESWAHSSKNNYELKFTPHKNKPLARVVKLNLKANQSNTEDTFKCRSGAETVMSGKFEAYLKKNDHIPDSELAHLKILFIKNIRALNTSSTLEQVRMASEALEKQFSEIICFAKCTTSLKKSGPVTSTYEVHIFDDFDANFSISFEVSVDTPESLLYQTQLHRDFDEARKYERIEKKLDKEFVCFHQLTQQLPNPTDYPFLSRFVSHNNGEYQLIRRPRDWQNALMKTLDLERFVSALNEQSSLKVIDAAESARQIDEIRGASHVHGIIMERSAFVFNTRVAQEANRHLSNVKDEMMKVRSLFDRYT